MVLNQRHFYQVIVVKDEVRINYHAEDWLEIIYQASLNINLLVIQNTTKREVQNRIQSKRVTVQSVWLWIK